MDWHKIVSPWLLKAFFTSCPFKPFVESSSLSTLTKSSYERIFCCGIDDSCPIGMLRNRRHLHCTTPALAGDARERSAGQVCGVRAVEPPGAHSSLRAAYHPGGSSGTSGTQGRGLHAHNDPPKGELLLRISARETITLARLPSFLP